jgi:acyl-CoA thioesterase
MTEYEELPPRFKQALLTKTKANSPFWQLLDMDLIDVKKGYAKTKIPYSKKQINYLKPFESGEIIAEAKIIHKGTQTAIGDVDIRDSNGSLVAKAISTYAIIHRDS